MKKTGKRFYCRALQGKSEYNICVNSDMTVSCNCQDYFGRGKLGSLKESTLQEIFDGEKAAHLRRQLFEGKMAIPECVGCPERKELEEGADESLLESYQVPDRGIMVENTAICNLKCLVCNRVDLMKTRGSKTMTLDEMRVVAEEIRKHGIRKVYFFNLGEPFLSKDVLEELRALREASPDVFIHTSTHGMYLDSDDKVEAALLMDQVSFSIDGSDQESVVKYQVGANFEKSWRNMKGLAAAKKARGLKKPIVEWKYVLFPWNVERAHILRAERLAKEAGVDLLSFYLGGGDEDKTLSGEGFRDLPALRGVGYKCKKGREVNFRMVDTEEQKRLLESWSEVAEPPGGSGKAEREDLISRMVACIENGATVGNAAFVDRAYKVILQREPDEEGKRMYAAKLDAGDLTRGGLAAALLEAEEFRALQAVVA